MLSAKKIVLYLCLLAAIAALAIGVGVLINYMAAQNNLSGLDVVAPTAVPPPVTPSPTPQPTPEPTPGGLCGGRFDVFTDGEIIKTENSYQTKDTAVFFREVREKVSDITGKALVYYVADIYVQNIEDLRCGLVKEDIHSTMHMKNLAQSVDAIVAISGDFAAWRRSGICVRNGIVYRTSVDERRDVGILFKDGTFGTFEIGMYTENDVLPLDPWHVWTFGPELMDENGQAKDWFNTDVYTRNPRAVFGYYEPGHYCFVMVRGRVAESAGMNLAELSQLMAQLGCTSAFNLDGGATTQFYFDGKSYPGAGGARQVNDIVYLPLAS
ncbi:MAG: phosphodiester glycosidase family protein [Clostridiales bacterium]|nr:phosphodiester glycosidase family protein [Clostridiales bacterium]